MTRSSARQSAVATGAGVVLPGHLAARLPVLDVACNRCERRGRLRSERLVVQHGAYIPVPVLLRTIAADCPCMQAALLHDVCGVHLPQLSRLEL